ncbi:cell division protein ZapB [Paraperlucidibaca baekdonensis]|uniref:Cell division protein ZapB n=1 Tax=Paraperlucidibaca baekdonensis TaxID=748120 RepID=A0A3E0H8G5_9GAMM|nr:DUF904 domain-containing protein [Paraperlucidibaca baekdonensis]REH40011.1 cell division protein ZapB [Paraperlucidibaca baekdonensis]
MNLIVAADFLHGEPNMREQDFQALSGHLEQLLARYHASQQHCTALEARIQALENEREDLKHRNEVARDRVEAIITRLKALDTSS